MTSGKAVRSARTKYGYYTNTSGKRQPYPLNQHYGVPYYQELRGYIVTLLSAPENRIIRCWINVKLYMPLLLGIRDAMKSYETLINDNKDAAIEGSVQYIFRAAKDCSDVSLHLADAEEVDGGDDVDDARSRSKITAGRIKDSIQKSIEEERSDEASDSLKKRELGYSGTRNSSA